MAGFCRLCGRFRCVGGSMAHGGAEGAKFRRLRRLWGIVPAGRQGRGAARAARPCARVIRRTVQVLNAPLNAGGCALLREGQTEGGGAVKIVSVSSKKWGWMVSWIVIWVVIGA